jgi:hypothetical protein
MLDSSLTESGIERCPKNRAAKWFEQALNGASLEKIGWKTVFRPSGHKYHGNDLATPNQLVLKLGAGHLGH